MKNIFKFSIIATLCALCIVACQSPEDLTPSVSREGINSLTASFPDDNSDENKFVSEIDYVNHVITIVIPYNYPLTSTTVTTVDKITKMRIKANLDDNVSIEPALLYLDLSKENNIILTDQTRLKIPYKIVAEIRKSNASAITKYLSIAAIPVVIFLAVMPKSTSFLAHSNFILFGRRPNSVF